MSTAGWLADPRFAVVPRDLWRRLTLPTPQQVELVPEMEFGVEGLMMRFVDVESPLEWANRAGFENIVEGVGGGRVRGSDLVIGYACRSRGLKGCLCPPTSDTGAPPGRHHPLDLFTATTKDLAGLVDVANLTDHLVSIRLAVSPDCAGAEEFA